MITVNTNRMKSAEGSDLFDAEYKGLSKDTDRPTEGVPINSLFLELDTGKFFYFDGEAWSPVGGE